jgi:hypothetical protein
MKASLDYLLENKKDLCKEQEAGLLPSVSDGPQGDPSALERLSQEHRLQSPCVCTQGPG